MAVAAVGALASTMLGTAPNASASEWTVGQQLVADSFTHSMSGGWAAAGTGGTYTLTQPSAFSESGSTGRVTASPGVSRRAVLSSVSVADVTASTTMSTSSLPGRGNGIYGGLQARVSGSTYYQGGLRMDPAGRIFVSALRVNGSTATQTSLGEVRLAASTTGSVRVEVRVTGTAPVHVQVRAWDPTAAAPDWQIDKTDDSAQRISSAGSIGLWTYLSKQADAPQLVSFDDLAAYGMQPVATTPPTAPAVPAPPVTPTPTPTPTPPVTAPPTGNAPTSSGSAGAAAIGSTRYPVAAGAVYVAPGGSDTAAGTQSAPLATIQKAVDRTPSGGMVVLRGGSYHQSVVLPSGKKITLQNAPGEAVRLDGSEAVSGFAQSGSSYVVSGWNHPFDSSPTFTRGAADNTAAAWSFIDPAYPMAAHPDQVWIDGVAQKQVASAGQVVPGAFYVDYGAQKLYLGSNPSGHEVRASTLVKAMYIGGNDSTVRGIAIQRYAPSVPDMGALTIGGSQVTVENVAITDNATDGLYTWGTGTTLQNVSVQRNGLLGAGANYADGLQVHGLLAEDNTAEHFNRAPVSGGLKITRSRNVAVTDSVFDGNIGNGLWFDESVYNGTVTGNTITGSAGNSLVVELSAKFVVADNTISNGVLAGILINNTSGVQIWNNSISSVNKNIALAMDGRRAANLSDAGHDPRQKQPDPTMSWITSDITVSNNVMADSTGHAMLDVEDYSHQFSAAQLKITANGNLYRRPAASSPSWLIVWSRGPGDPAVYTNLDKFRSVGQELNSVLFDGGIVAALIGSPDSQPGAAAVPRPLPASIASLIGQPAGVSHLGSW